MRVLRDWWWLILLLAGLAIVGVGAALVFRADTSKQAQCRAAGGVYIWLWNKGPICLRSNAVIRLKP